MSGPAEQFGPYLVYEQLGMGGMASVHRAETPGIEGFSRPVALKRMLPHCAAEASLVQSFVHEARLASHLRHENVAQTYELGKVGDIYFIAMELVTGHSLREILKRGAKVTGPMPVPIALNILNQLCDALDYAHNLCDESGRPLGIVHRDVSPSNILIQGGSGVLKLIDFGIAKARNSTIQTMNGVVKGKFSYMAPEYIDGKLDARADLFAVGVIAHELLTNRPLFGGGDDLDTLMRVKNMPIEPPSWTNPQVPPEVDEIVMTALQRHPDRRWQHATALRTAMTTLTRRLGLVAHNAQVLEWIDWAFAQRPRSPDDDPDISISQTGATMTPAASAMITKVDLPLPVPVPGAPVPAYRPSHPHVITRGSERTEPTNVAATLVNAPAVTMPVVEKPVDPPAAAPEPVTIAIPRTRTSPSRPPANKPRTGGGTASAASRKGVWLAVLLLVAAAGTAAVVYFALPYL